MGPDDTGFVYHGDVRKLDSPRDSRGDGSRTVISEVGDTKVSLIRLPRGGELPSHRHAQSWDCLLCVSGEGIVTVTNGKGEHSECAFVPNALVSVPPNVTHRVSNTSAQLPLEYVAIQGPDSVYNFEVVHGD